VRKRRTLSAVLTFVLLAMLVCTASLSRAEETITFKAVGDIVFPPGEFKKDVFGNVKSHLEADFLVGNLEGPITDQSVAAKKTNGVNTFAFKFSPRAAPPALKQAGFDVLHIGNNHLFDYGPNGLEDTQRALKNATIAYVGLKNRTITLEKDGLAVAFVGFAYSPRLNDLHDTEGSARQVREAKSRAPIVVVSVHAGAEGTGAQEVHDEEEIFLGERRGNLVRFAHAMVDAGASCVIGSGPHVLRAMEIYKGVPIAYSLGNFLPVGGLKATGLPGVSAVLELVFSTPDGAFLKGTIIPIRFDDAKLPRHDPEGAGIFIVRDLTERYYDTYRDGDMNIWIDDDGSIVPLRP
jgi:poly-gamma-glutamate capsule biosynthesis protein CapA/YwtB (metallophosphatase superfamily)